MKRNIPWEDTLLAHHAFASHLPQRLDWCVSEYLDTTPWKCEHGRRGGLGAADEKGFAGAVSDMGVGKLLHYNAADCKFTSKLWQRMQSDLSSEWQVYAHDLELASVCRDMARVGIGIDFARKTDLSTAMVQSAYQIKGQLREIVGNPAFEPSKLADVRLALFGQFQCRVYAITETGLPKTNNVVLEAIAGDDTPLSKFATLLLKWRGLMKARSTYVGGVGDKLLKFDSVVGKDGRAHYNWKSFGTVSGRLACRLQSCPRWNPDDLSMRAREIYVPSAGNEFVYWDVSQAEMRLAAYLSADPVFMRTCDGDVHANNAKLVFPEVAKKGWLDGDAKKDPRRGKEFRDVAKSLGFAICYGAEAERLYTTLAAKGLNITLRALEAVLSNLRRSYKVYYKWVEANVEAVRRCGYMRSPILGRIRWFGQWPKPTEISNYPVQSGLADVMNRRTIDLSKRLPVGCNLVAQIHDAGIIDTPKKYVKTVQNMISELWAEPISLPGGSLILPIDLKVGDRLSAL